MSSPIRNYPIQDRLLAVIRYCQTHELAFPSLDIVARITGVSRESVHKHITRMTEAGVVERRDTGPRERFYRVVLEMAE
jgi:DNA-binding IclR family transcriptional regulator